MASFGNAGEMESLIDSFSGMGPNMHARRRRGAATSSAIESISKQLQHVSMGRVAGAGRGRGFNLADAMQTMRDDEAADCDNSCPADAEQPTGKFSYQLGKLGNGGVVVASGPGDEAPPAPRAQRGRGNALRAIAASCSQSRYTPYQKRTWVWEEEVHPSEEVAQYLSRAVEVRSASGSVFRGTLTAFSKPPRSRGRGTALLHASGSPPAEAAAAARLPQALRLSNCFPVSAKDGDAVSHAVQAASRVFLMNDIAALTLAERRSSSIEELDVDVDEGADESAQDSVSARPEPPPVRRRGEALPSDILSAIMGMGNLSLK